MKSFVALQISASLARPPSTCYTAPSSEDHNSNSTPLTIPDLSKAQLIISDFFNVCHNLHCWITAPLALLPKLATRLWILVLLHYLGLPYWHYQLVLSWYPHQPESHQLCWYNLSQSVRETRTHRLDPRITWVRLLSGIDLVLCFIFKLEILLLQQLDLWHTSLTKIREFYIHMFERTSQLENLSLEFSYQVRCSL